MHRVMIDRHCCCCRFNSHLLPLRVTNDLLLISSSSSWRYGVFLLNFYFFPPLEAGEVGVAMPKFFLAKVGVVGIRTFGREGDVAIVGYSSCGAWNFIASFYGGGMLEESVAGFIDRRK